MSVLPLRSATWVPLYEARTIRYALSVRAWLTQMTIGSSFGLAAFAQANSTPWRTPSCTSSFFSLAARSPGLPPCTTVPLTPVACSSSERNGLAAIASMASDRPGNIVPVRPTVIPSCARASSRGSRSNAATPTPHSPRNARRRMLIPLLGSLAVLVPLRCFRPLLVSPSPLGDGPQPEARARVQRNSPRSRFGLRQTRPLFGLQIRPVVRRGSLLV